MKPGKSATILTSLLVTGAGIYGAAVSRKHFVDRTKFVCSTCGVSTTSTRYVGINVHTSKDPPAYDQWVHTALPDHKKHQWVFRTGYSRGWGSTIHASSRDESPSYLPQLHAKFGDVEPLRELLRECAATASRGEVVADAMRARAEAVATALEPGAVDKK